MLKPPFKLAAVTAAASEAAGTGMWVEVPRGAGEETDAAPPGRMRLVDLDSHLHCSVIGTCLGTRELRKIVARFALIDSSTANDLEVHHEAVRLASQGGPAAKALHKALDQRYDAVLKRFARARGSDAVEACWDEAREKGEIPGAYWALLTHRDTNSDLRQRAFGEVHMLSHLVGAANRADIRRLVALENENAELRERLERQQGRSQETLAERDAAMAALQRELEALRDSAAVRRSTVPGPSIQQWREEAEAATTEARLQSERRERAEASAQAARADAARLRGELEELRAGYNLLRRELDAVESELRGASGASRAPLEAQLRGRKLLYVGGRPASVQAIRDLVLRHGGGFDAHDGGIEDRKGLLAAAVAGADLVVFPVDCIDHNSAGVLKRICTQTGLPFLPLRSASLASFISALSAPDPASGHARPNVPRFCLKHG